MLRLTLAPLVLLSLLAAPAWSDEAARANAPAPMPAEVSEDANKPAKASKEPKQPTEGEDRLVVTQHELKIGDRSLKYKATAGTLLMKDESGKPKANVFFVAYERSRKSAEKAAARPITFVFNGGPGAAAVWLHLGTAGPKRVDLTEKGEAPPPPYRTVDNPWTWLDATDLVFIDPVGTGFSRPAPGEKQEQFSGVQEDIQSVADFIRLYLTRNDRWESPKFLAGESYGTTRAAGLSEFLLDQRGIGLNGIIFISTVLNFATLAPGRGNELPYALYLPSYTAIAGYHKKLPTDLQADPEAAARASEKYAIERYTPALAKGAALSKADRAEAAEQLARFTGLPPETIEQADLRIDPSLFRKTLLKNDRRMMGRFDARITAYDPNPLAPYPDFDPSLSPYLAAYTGAFNAYVRQELNYKSDLQYEVLSGKVQPWNFGRAGSGYLDVSNNLESAIRKNPHMRVLFASGAYDLATPYFATQYTADHLELSPELRRNITHTRYPGGHMLYHHRPSLEQLHADVIAFIKKAAPRESTDPTTKDSPAEDTPAAAGDSGREQGSMKRD